MSCIWYPHIWKKQSALSRQVQIGLSKAQIGSWNHVDHFLSLIPEWFPESCKSDGNSKTSHSDPRRFFYKEFSSVNSMDKWDLTSIGKNYTWCYKGELLTHMKNAITLTITINFNIEEIIVNKYYYLHHGKNLIYRFAPRVI